MEQDRKELRARMESLEARAKTNELRLAAFEKKLGVQFVANPELEKEILRLENRLRELEERRKQREQERRESEVAIKAEPTAVAVASLRVTESTAVEERASTTAEASQGESEIAEVVVVQQKGETEIGSKNEASKNTNSNILGHEFQRQPQSRMEMKKKLSIQRQWVTLDQKGKASLKSVVHQFNLEAMDERRGVGKTIGNRRSRRRKIHQLPKVMEKRNHQPPSALIRGRAKVSPAAEHRQPQKTQLHQRPPPKPPHVGVRVLHAGGLLNRHPCRPKEEAKWLPAKLPDLFGMLGLLSGHSSALVPLLVSSGVAVRILMRRAGRAEEVTPWGQLFDQIGHEVSGSISTQKLFYQFLLPIGRREEHVLVLQHNSFPDKFSEVVDRTHVLASDKFQVGVRYLSLAQMLGYVRGRERTGQAQIRKWAGGVVTARNDLDFMCHTQQIGGHIAFLGCLDTFQADTGTVYENGLRVYFKCSRDWLNTSYMADFLQREQNYRLEWYSVLELLIHRQPSATMSRQSNASIELGASFQSLGCQSVVFYIWVWGQEHNWKYQHMCESWNFFQFGLHGGELIYSADSSCGQFENLWACYGKMPTHLFISGFALEDAATLLLQLACNSWLIGKMFLQQWDLGRVRFSSPVNIFTKSYLLWTLCFKLWDPG